MSFFSKKIAPALCSACRRVMAPCSSTKVRARQATGSHLLRVEGYSLVDKKLAAGSTISSSEFPVGSCQWRLNFCPKGSGNPDSVRAYLSMQPEGYFGRETMAEYKISILDRAGDPAYTGTMGPHRVSGFTSPGIDLVRAKELSDAVPRLVDDDGCLNVRCDVTALQMEHDDSS
ncbi:hypothetical protein ACP70R_007719 [Stipagrostis hirtigluma subsp. patula]